MLRYQTGFNTHKSTALKKRIKWNATVESQTGSKSKQIKLKYKPQAAEIIRYAYVFMHTKTIKCTGIFGLKGLTEQRQTLTDVFVFFLNFEESDFEGPCR